MYALRCLFFVREFLLRDSFVNFKTDDAQYLVTYIRGNRPSTTRFLRREGKEKDRQKRGLERKRGKEKSYATPREQFAWKRRHSRGSLQARGVETAPGGVVGRKRMRLS